MKVVINKCYGGFGLSPLAIKALAVKKSTAINRSPIEDWVKIGSIFKIGDDLGDGYNTFGYNQATDGEYVYDLKYGNEMRSHPDVIAIVEELGERADGEYSKLEITEVPDGIRWTIEDYDGIEHIAEAHRKWY